MGHQALDRPNRDPMSRDIRITLPDGSVRPMPAGTTARAVAESIGPRPAPDGGGAKVNGEIWDLSRPIHQDAAVEILTPKAAGARYVPPHPSAHVLATAVRQLFPEAGIGFGPPIDDGFYYDFEVPRPFTPEDLERIEQRMQEVVKADYPFVREEVDRHDARGRFKDDPLKLERLEELGDDEVISVSTDGPFVDLCRGPHVPSTGHVKHFKLLHGAGAYWRGDSRRQMLQRIYGTAYFTKDDLAADLRRREEAEKRDHRVLGKQLALFTIQEDIGRGLILWHPRGAVIQFELRRLIEDEILKRGYQLVYTPHVQRGQLFIRSGHLPWYEHNQYPAMAAAAGAAGGVGDRGKARDCPFHIMVYAPR